MKTRETMASLLWHKETITALRSTLAYQERELSGLRERVFKLRADVEFYERQITEAERRGKTAFDRDRFLKTR